MENKKLRDEIRTEIYTAISDMLGNPGECEIYPTTKCYDRLETFFFKRENKLMEELQALQKLIDEAGEELPEKKRGVIAILDKEGKKYYSAKQLPDGAYNQAIDQCIPVVAKLKQKNAELKQERDKAYKKLDNDTMAVLGFQIKIVELKQENEQLKERLS